MERKRDNRRAEKDKRRETGFLSRRDLDRLSSATDFEVYSSGARDAHAARQRSSLKDRRHLDGTTDFGASASDDGQQRVSTDETPSLEMALKGAQADGGREDAVAVVQGVDGAPAAAGAEVFQGEESLQGGTHSEKTSGGTLQRSRVVIADPMPGSVQAPTMTASDALDATSMIVRERSGARAVTHTTTDMPQRTPGASAADSQTPRAERPWPRPEAVPVTKPAEKARGDMFASDDLDATGDILRERLTSRRLRTEPTNVRTSDAAAETSDVVAIREFVASARSEATDRGHDQSTVFDDSAAKRVPDSVTKSESGHEGQSEWGSSVGRGDRRETTRREREQQRKTRGRVSIGGLFGRKVRPKSVTIAHAKDDGRPEVAEAERAVALSPTYEDAGHQGTFAPNHTPTVDVQPKAIGAPAVEPRRLEPAAERTTSTDVDTTPGAPAAAASLGSKTNAALAAATPADDFDLTHAMGQGTHAAPEGQKAATGGGWAAETPMFREAQAYEESRRESAPSYPGHEEAPRHEGAKARERDSSSHAHGRHDKAEKGMSHTKRGGAGKKRTPKQQRTMLVAAVGTVILVAVVAMMLLIRGASPTSSPPTAAQQQLGTTAVVYRGDFTDAISVDGTTEPLMISEVTTQVDGIVENLVIGQGSYVTAGDVLFKVRNEMLENAVTDAESQVSAATRSVNDTDLAYRQAQANYQNAWNIAAMSNNWATFDQTGLTNAINAAAARNSEAVAALDNAKATLAAAQEALERCYVRAPISGIVVELNVADGSSVGAGTQDLVGGVTGVLLKVGDITQMKVTVLVSELNVPAIHEGQAATVSFPALPGVVSAASVTAISTMASGVAADANGTASYAVELLISAPDPNLRPGMTATVNIVLQSATNTLIIPSRAIWQEVGADGSTHYYVNVISDTNETRKAEVSITAQNEQEAAVWGEIGEGETVRVN